ncbi:MULTISPECIES: hypothetical protein [Acinetobacter]|uniref:hypothetical protein n=1 Tax=Acinetobacter TaxID=469 RepID=UPI0002D096EE|nr:MULTISPECIES: hypothetical protein [Acinetobacter]ENV03903.1 hypothetical protein F968_00965 [Acinetobacter sp. NIPH 817]MCU4635034.1 DUF2345 domain-containing protein [Acinetobacter sp. WU_MDCI_Abxa265]RFF25850.1 hypothetical protein DZ985_01110 [Acinetobacter sp. JW]
MAGGSQIIINKSGITVITPSKFEVKAGQHRFKPGAQVQMPQIALPQPICIECLVKAAKEGAGIVRR